MGPIRLSPAGSSPAAKTDKTHTTRRAVQRACRYPLPMAALGANTDAGTNLDKETMAIVHQAMHAFKMAGVLSLTAKVDGNPDGSEAGARLLAHSQAPTMLLEVLLCGSVLSTPTLAVEVYLTAAERDAVLLYLQTMLLADVRSGGGAEGLRSFLGCGNGAQRMLATCWRAREVAEAMIAPAPLDARTTKALDVLNAELVCAAADIRRVCSLRPVGRIFEAVIQTPVLHTLAWKAVDLARNLVRQQAASGWRATGDLRTDIEREMQEAAVCRARGPVRA